MSIEVCRRSRQPERRAAPSRAASPRGIVPRTRGARGSMSGGTIVLMYLPIFQLVEQVQ
ncbi:hypothetical protein G8A07_26040 [Roseateles sp. DAIF2]|uniref:hypothetical protein n=1 Tax=Roseateles sp. DAIF2 TaxID=2714952 RepID=UPI0018A2EC5D|nr:hypothetical protein [Roseateles sp. DAIF2]QPF76041.1 hypothetical protein G8A07_26040 [Roseateles sp. DAIF2]